MSVDSSGIPWYALSADPAIRARIDARLRAWCRADFARRLWAKDYTLWSPVPVLELADRLGWLDLPGAMPGAVGDLRTFAQEVQAEGARHVVLLGMGGSSLAPEVFQRTFGHGSGHPELIVLDSTHPAAVRVVEARLDLRRTLFLVSSKSGTTTETLSFFRHFWRAVAAANATPGEHFVAITDPGTPLSRLAEQHGFRRVFLAPPDVGGRYSALSVFGLVPAVLIGVDLEPLARAAVTMARACTAAAPDNPGLALGASLGELALAGRDKLTFFTSPSLTALPWWVEQLIAESTGKDGRGIVPICDEPLAPAETYGDDRVFVSIQLAGEPSRPLDAALARLEAAGHPVIRIELAQKADLGAEFFRWEVATAAAGAALGIQPFDQPDVQLAKDLAAQVMAQRAASSTEYEVGIPVEHTWALDDALRAWLQQVKTGDYVGIQAYLAPTDETAGAFARIRTLIAATYGVATTLGYGPRFLHSTGQLHKGGPPTGIFLQCVDEPPDDLPVPDSPYTFGALIRAQALGDLRALLQRGRRVLKVHVGRNAAWGLARLEERLRAAVVQPPKS